jgi:hypothetical protein
MSVSLVIAIAQANDPDLRAHHHHGTEMQQRWKKKHAFVVRMSNHEDVQ